MNSFNILEIIETATVAFSNFMWGMPLLILLLGGGSFFMIYSRFLPFRYLGHAVNVLRGKHDDPNDPGEINHYQALSSAIAATVGMGNISGVAVAITTGGPGALFWMWVAAFVGIATKFFTCSLAVMYRGKDSAGKLQGGPMYVIMEGLGTQWKPLAVLFCVACMCGALPIFQANQLTQVIRDLLLVPNGIVDADNTFASDFITGVVITIIVSAVIFGGLQRIASVAGKLVPFMVVTYTLSVGYILLTNLSDIPGYLGLIVSDAFSGEAVMGGAVGSVIIQGARRAAFSNEAGIGTAPLMHGAAKTKEPIREGLVAMLGPAIDTLLVCTLTALTILITGVWQSGDQNGVTLTATAFETAIPGVGVYLLMLAVLVFSLTTLFSFSYYGTKCTSFLLGDQYKKYYNFFYVGTIIFGSVSSLQAVISLIDGMYAVMAIPTMVSGILLAPKVKDAAKDYFSRMERK